MPLAGSGRAVYRTAYRAGFMVDNHATMSSSVQPLTEEFPDSQEVYYLKQVQQCHES